MQNLIIVNIIWITAHAYSSTEMMSMRILLPVIDLLSHGALLSVVSQAFRAFPMFFVQA